MDAKEFVRQRNRMCRENSARSKPCTDCPAAEYCCVRIDEVEDEDFELIDIVEKWAKENPDAAVKETPDGGMTMEEKFECGRCGYYENTGCPEHEGFCVELEITVCECECICQKFEEVE